MNVYMCAYVSGYIHKIKGERGGKWERGRNVRIIKK